MGDTIKVHLVLEAVMCDHCDTYFGIPTTFDGKPFHCPRGHVNPGRPFSTGDSPPQQQIPKGG